MENSEEIKLEGGTYEIIRDRLSKHGKQLQERLNTLNVERKNVFGAIETTLVSTERITTENNCLPRDMVPVGDNFIFGYNVHIGLRTEIKISDVFSVYKYANHNFSQIEYDLINNEEFQTDFHNLYKYYKNAEFLKFVEQGPYLFFVFQIGNSVNDIKAFKWNIKGKQLIYVDNRSEYEIAFPEQHEFQWIKTTRDQHVGGEHPHISIDDIVFVETVSGDLTIKIEDNTSSGKGIYSEPVEHKDQTLDDALIYYAIVGNLVVLKIQPYQEKDFRYLVFNNKVKTVTRIDALEKSGVLLPDDHGLIFSKGYYLQSGEYKVFENQLEDMIFEKRIASPNGEDYLYVFYNELSGTYILLSYNIIEQKVETPIICHGYSIFDNGEMCFFKNDDEQKKHHAVQIWQTPFLDHSFIPEEKNDSELQKIGNKDIVRAMSECNEVIRLINKEDSYANLYYDIVKGTNDVLDSYHWINKIKISDIHEPLTAIKESAASAIDEFDKVVKVKEHTKEETEKTQGIVAGLLRSIKIKNFDLIDHFVEVLGQIRGVRGSIIQLKELRYVDIELVNELDEKIAHHQEDISQRCVQFLLDEKSLAPYLIKVEGLKSSIDKLEKVVEAKELEKNVMAVSAELELLIEIVSNLKIEDATQTTKIIDSISDIYAQFNQINTALKKKRKALLSKEGKAEFNSQLKLISQSVVNFLDVSETPEKCDEYLTKLMVQLEELEGKFSEFDEYITLISEKREEVYNAFESRKIALIESRNKRATTLQQSAERILKGIKNRVGNLKTPVEINGYFASDIMVSKIRDIVAQLIELKDAVKADDIQSQFKTVKEDALRQLKDKTELFVDGKDIIQMGKHQFSVNTQALDLTIVLRNGEMCFHLTGTNYFEPVTNPEFLATEEVWDQTYISENKAVYRSEYLAYQIIKQIESKELISSSKFLSLSEKEQLSIVQQFMSNKYEEGYAKGIHDVDANTILTTALTIAKHADLLVFNSYERACAKFFWEKHINSALKEELNPQLKAAGIVMEVFPETNEFNHLKNTLIDTLTNFIKETGLYTNANVANTANYLFAEISRGDQFILSQEALELFDQFNLYLTKIDAKKTFNNSIKSLEKSAKSQVLLMQNWLKAYLEAHPKNNHLKEYVEEVSISVISSDKEKPKVIKVKTSQSLSNFTGNHSKVDGDYIFDYNVFNKQLYDFETVSVPKFQQYQELKKDIIHEFKDELRLHEFKAKVMTSFVRNKLIDEVYFPLIGDNLAKQMGTAGENKRTDLMGMLLLISPPGYGKTTLMEYIANRLGLVFMKINGPTIGHHVTSLDPSEAPNASAKEEIEKLNLAFEMGDNVMIYLDDIQHCNPELLQKFISLCDAQRKIEGVYKGKSKTYDLRGKKVAIVMAGNPYTESGDKFQIPDMLSNRADIYNLGDITGGKGDVFELSYIENSLTSNTVLQHLAAKNFNDVYAFIRVAETGSQEGVEFEGNHSGQEIKEYIAILEKVLIVRDTLTKVNAQYIYSAGQEEKYRTEPSFKLQGSYRDMNKIVEKLVPIMNEKELQTIIMSHYENESQTLTTGAEANILKFKELQGILTEEDAKRWKEIKSVFMQTQKMKGLGENNQTAQVLLQMEDMSKSLGAIAYEIGKGLEAK